MPEAERPAPRLIVFSDTTQAPASLLLERFARLAHAARPGSVLFTLRDYSLSLPLRWALGEQLSALAKRAQQQFGIADRADWARALGCTGFHLPAGGLRATDARRYLGPAVFLSRGEHDPSSAPEPELDAVLLSPIFEMRKGRPALGVAAIAQAARAAAPAAPSLFALGGVAACNAAACSAAGAAGVAVIGAALAVDPEPLLASLGVLRA